MLGKFFQITYLIATVIIPTFASAQNYVIQKDHSQIFFRVSYLSHGHVQGQFKRFEGSLVLGPGEVIEQLSVSIDATSVDTGQVQRDGHLRGHDFFYTQKFPKISFEYQKTLSRKASKYLIEGLLRLKNVQRRHTFELTLGPEERDSWGYASRFVELKTTLNRQGYDLAWNKTLSGLNFLVSDEVVVTGIVQLQLVNALTPAPKHMIPDGPAMRQREQAQRGEIDPVKPVSSLSQSASTSALLKPKRSGAPGLPARAQSVQPSPRRAVHEDPWFWVLGLMGFAASIILGVFGKKIVMDHFPEYEEDSLKGHLSDFITIGFSLLYAIAYWLVGWGA